jgi:glycosyltransferase involved in cell wall biosynthesis
MYKVTLSMPVYNVENYVERALLSALNQTFESIEYLIVDDKGTDNSMEIVRKIIATHPRGKDVRIIAHDVNIGLGAGRNSAIDNAQGKYLYFMDSDDEITPDCISFLYEKMMETPVDFVAASHTAMLLSEQYKDFYYAPVYVDTLIQSSDYAVAKAVYFEELQIMGYSWNKLYNVNFLRGNNILCTPHHLPEDIFFTYQIILNAQSCRLLPNITYRYYETKNSHAKECNFILTPRIGKHFEEIIILKANYAKKYRETVFYSQLITQNYQYATTIACLLHQSKLISRKDKNAHIANMLKYPLSINEIKRIKIRYNVKKQKYFHLSRKFISKLPSIRLKLFILSDLRKFESKIRKLLGTFSDSWIKISGK